MHTALGVSPAPTMIRGAYGRPCSRSGRALPAQAAGRPTRCSASSSFARAEATLLTATPAWHGAHIGWYLACRARRSSAGEPTAAEVPARRSTTPRSNAAIRVPSSSSEAAQRAATFARSERRGLVPTFCDPRRPSKKVDGDTVLYANPAAEQFGTGASLLIGHSPRNSARPPAFSLLIQVRLSAAARARDAELAAHHSRCMILMSPARRRSGGDCR